MFCAISSCVFDCTKSWIVFSGDLESGGGEDVMRRHGEDRMVGRWVRRIVLSGWRDAMVHQVVRRV